MLRFAALRPGQELPEHTVRARNFATASENKIHEDSVAKQYGFAGGLVPGVTVYAYMTRPVVEVLGRDWLAYGTATARFLKPFYEGEMVRVRTRAADAGSDLARLELEAYNGDGQLCAVASAALPATLTAPPAVTGYPAATLPAQRPPVSEEALRAIGALGTVEATYDARVKAARFCDEIGDDWGGYFGPGAVGHPGVLIRYANSALALNVLLNPWIHVSSDITHFSLVRDGDVVSTRGRVASLFERKGHKFVDLDLLMVANGERPIMHVRHTAIYDVRKVGE
ncbi:MAG: MaoC family dehydratase [Thermoflexaceae bacterium]|nr:MaoC family dehydratase [Thermoflexaceae bacterium]